MSGNLTRTFFRPVCSTILMAGILFSNTSTAATWQEQGDAGSLLNSAQSILGVGNVETIEGKISARSDVDLYKIYISDPSAFSAVVSGGGDVAGDTDWDSKLWLFDENGLGIYANDDAVNRNEADAGLPSSHALGPQVAGNYFLAISDDDVSPFSGPTLNDLIFAVSNSPYTAILAPTGGGSTSPLTDWRSASSTVIDYANANYSIALNGAELVPSAEMQSQIEFIERFYVNILGRASDQDGLNYWLNIIQTQSGAKVAFGFLNSNEFLALNLDKPDFVNILYKTMFDREPDESGLGFWLSNLDAGYSRDEVIYGFVSSLEFAALADSFDVTPISENEETEFLIDNFVRRFYKFVLNRDPDTVGNDYWTSKLLNGDETGGNIARGFFKSSEFLARNTTDDEFVEIAYQAIFGRTSDLDGKQNWLGRLAAGTTREELINGFIISQEFSVLAERFGIRAN